MKKELNRKGFTLAELLIVVAIIAILIAIAIPVFGKQLERSRDSASAANLRSAYAQAMVASLATSNDSNDDSVTILSDGTVTSKLNRNFIAVSGVKIMSTDASLGDMEADLPCLIFNKELKSVISDKIATANNFLDESVALTAANASKIFALTGPDTYQVIFWFQNNDKAIAFFNPSTQEAVTTVKMGTGANVEKISEFGRS